MHIRGQASGCRSLAHTFGNLIDVLSKKKSPRLTNPSRCIDSMRDVVDVFEDL